MSDFIGEHLPREVLSAFNGEELLSKIGLAYLIVTVDPEGTPRPCMLSMGEILAIDDSHLRLAIWRGTHTDANLAAGSPVLMCYVEDRLVLYIRGQTRLLCEDQEASQTYYELEVSSVERDDHPGMPVVDTIRFSVEGASLDETVGEWEERLKRLRQA
jgi:hypothetical protein